MKFFLSFMLLVLPLFLMVCIQIIRQNEDFKASVFGKFLVGLFFVFAVASLGAAVYLFAQI